MATSVIQTTGMMEFEDGLRTGVLPGAAGVLVVAATSLVQIPLGVRVGPGLGVVVRRTSF